MTEIALLSGSTALLFTIAILVYFRVAERFNIIDRPNERSSHITPTIRGGGVIFAFAILCFALLNGFQFYYFLIGFFAIAIISFIDDVKTLANSWRLLVHFIAMVLLILQITIHDELAWWYWPIFMVFAIGIVNAYNFMDGINGITGLYSLVFFATILYLQQTAQLDLPLELILLPLISILVFNFFNVRKKARCFAGDVGSVSLAFIVLFFLGSISWQQQEWMYIWLLGVYGVDSVLTIAQRLYLRQNIFKAHRMHLYQFMANEGKVPHIHVSFAYAITQLVFNILLIGYLIPNGFNSLYINIIIGIIFLFLYVALKYRFQPKNHL